VPPGQWGTKTELVSLVEGLDARLMKVLREKSYCCEIQKKKGETV
jgi:hypothetical protein